MTPCPCECSHWVMHIKNVFGSAINTAFLLWYQVYKVSDKLHYLNEIFHVKQESIHINYELTVYIWIIPCRLETLQPFLIFKFRSILSSTEHMIMDCVCWVRSMSVPGFHPTRVFFLPMPVRRYGSLRTPATEEWV